MKLFAFALALHTCLLAPLEAQRLENLSQSVAIRDAYAPVVQRANRSVVEVVIDGKPRVLGTVVAVDLIVTKFSELNRKGQESDTELPVTCRQGEHSWSCSQLAFDRAADLVLLRVKGAKLTPIQWQLKVPAVGAFLATPDGSKMPLGVGILASSPYSHTRAFLGIRFANQSGKAELAEALEDGGARAAGLRRGDIVVHFADSSIESTEELRTAIRNHVPGDKVQVKVLRGDTRLSFDVTLGSNANTPVSSQEGLWGDLSSVRTGFGNVLQHDTILQPRDCGGPVVDLTGRALGVNIARAGRVETLAIPAATVQKLVAKMQRTAEAIRRGGK